MENYLIFTYGTLMKGECRHHVLSNSEFIGDAVLEDYALLELYSYPGAIKKEGFKVYGEVYRVSKELKKELDYIEGEGYLYAFKEVDVICNGEKLKVGFYEFLKDDGSFKLMEGERKWSAH